MIGVRHFVWHVARRPTGDRAIALGLTAACLALAVAQRPGQVIADTKIDLYVDPGEFLTRVAAAWTPTGSLGHVFGGQYGGYLFPMAPWFALGELAGVPLWIVHRLWLGALLAASAYGVLRLLDALLGRPRGAAHAAAAALYVLNPYVAVYANRTSVALLAYAALPWLLLAVHRGLREPRGWRWPAAFALALTCTGGGVNAATTAWLLLGPALLLAYERLAGGVAGRSAGAFLLRLAPITALANAWWVLPVVVHARYGLNFLPFTEQPGTIWGPTSVTESLRLMGFWTSYIGVGFGGVLRPFASHGPPLLFDAPILTAGLAVPALALGGFAWTRRWRYGPFFLALVLAGVLVMSAGFPEGTPLRRALTGVYYHVQAVQFLRTTYKAGPLVALGLAVLGGGAFGLAWSRWAPARARVALAAGALALAGAAAWPLTSGRAPEPQLAFKVPAAWRDAARAVDRLPPGDRALVLPGELFAYYDWGGTIDPILPSLAHRPVAEHTLVPYADLRAVDLLASVDALVTQERAVPGQLPALLDLLGVGAVVTSTDVDRSRAGAVGPVEAADVLGRRGRAFGAWRTLPAAAGRVRGPVRLPRVRVARVRTGGLVRLVAREPETIVDGGGEGIAELAAFGMLRPDRPLAYAADAGTARVRAAARAGGELVVTDSNRRRAYVASRYRANTGATLEPGQDVSADGTMLEPFGRGPDGQTVARVAGGVSVTAPASPQVTQFPEHQPLAAVDGDPRTAWLADRLLSRSRHHLDVGFDRPRDVPAIDLMPYDDSRGVVTRVAVNGRTFGVRRGWNHLVVGLRGVRELSVRIADVRGPRRRAAAGGGIRELRVPGLRVHETLRPPVLVERALRGADLRRAALTYLLARTTIDAPGREGPPVGPWQAGLLRDRVDPEPRLARTIDPPAARRWRADAWIGVDPGASDAALDRLAGDEAETGFVATSSGRYQNDPSARASSAFDGDRTTAWLGPWSARRPVLRWRTRRAVTVRRLRLVAPRLTVRAPVRVALAVDGHAPALLAVRRGAVALPAPVHGRRFALTVLRARFPRGATGLERMRRAVGIAEVLGVPGARARPRRRGALRGRCGDATIETAAGRIALRVSGDVADLDAARPVRAIACGPPIALPAGRQDLFGGRGVVRVDQLRLRSPAPQPAPSPSTAGSVLAPGHPGDGERDGVRLDVRRPGWLVDGESYNRGWRATCDGRSLGAPVPMQGYANAWRVRPGCRNVDVAFAPDRVLPWGYGISLVTCLALAAALLLRRRRPSAAASPLAPLPDEPAPPRWPLPRALAAGAAAAVVLGFVFALRAGVVLGPAVALVLARGIPARRLALAAGALLLVPVPILYATAGGDRGGYDTNYAADRIAAHWVGVLALCCLGAALWRTLSALNTARDPAAAARRSTP
ncbi:MAG: DUF3367 domain-containing protein [Actinobacteria bacterium]|nr:MAG: DUF3367 domain-containing protein [Actinomycetota bacterium]